MAVNKTRASLIRLQKHKVDELRRQVGELEAMRAGLLRQVEDLDATLRREAQRAREDDVARFAYPGFSRSVEDRKTNLRTSAAEIEAEINRVKADLGEAYQDLKRIELVEEARLDRERAAAARLEQSQMDELAARRSGM